MAASTELPVGSELLGYRIEGVLGRGGMGIVYLAEDQRLKRRVALKLIAPELSGDTRFRERFLAESELAVSIEHPNVVPIHDAGEVEGRLYLAMRYVEGSDLKALLRAEGSLEPARALSVCAQVGAALDAAHARGLVHRDVKPSNVLLDANEHVYLADFGLTKSPSDGTDAVPGRVIGTVDYVSPEQIRGEPVDGRADVYSLGCLLYACLVGHPPYPRRYELAVLWAHVQDEPPAVPSYPALDAVVARALAKEPADRYVTCAELVGAARDALGLGDPLPARSRRPVVLAAVGALIAAGVLTAGLVLSLDNGRTKLDLTVRTDTLVRVDPTTNRLAAVLSVGTRPASIAVGAKTVWVYNWDDSTVSAIAAKSGSVERTVSIPGTAVNTQMNGAIAADGNAAWVLSESGDGGGFLSRVLSGDSEARQFSVDGQPIAITAARDGLWVAAQGFGREAGHELVTRISRSTGTRLSTVTLRGAALSGQGPEFTDIRSLFVDGSSLWVSWGRTLFRVDRATARVTGRVDLPGSRVVRAVAGAGAVWALVSEPRHGPELLRVDRQTLRVLSTTVEPGGHGTEDLGRQDIAFGQGAVWWLASGLGSLFRVDPVTGRAVDTIRLTRSDSTGRLFEPLVVAAGAGSVWLAVTPPT